MSLLRACRNHIHFLVIAPLLIVVMTWPTFLYVFDTNTYWLPSENKDIFFKIWDLWYGRQILESRASFWYTDWLFYPLGTSLIYHQFAIPHMIAVGLLQLIMPLSNAYNLCFLLILFANAWATYLLLLYLFRDKWICVFGAALIAASPFFRLGSTVPDLTLIANLPLSVYFLMRAIRENRLSFAAASGLAAGATVFIGMYIFVCIALTLAMLGLYFARSHWSERRFWIHIVLLLSVMGALSMPRVGPMIADRDSLNAALEKGAEFPASNDLLGLFVLPSNPITDPFLGDAIAFGSDKYRYFGYLGYVPLVLTFLGLARPRYRRRMLPWLAILAFFLLLAFGETFSVNGLRYPDIALPKRLLDRVLPALFKSFWNATNFQIGALIPLAVLACYGLRSLAGRLSPSRAAPLVLALVVLLAIEYLAPVYPRVIGRGETDFIEWLEREEQDSVKLINLPMDRQTSKNYLFIQSVAGYPLVSGAANRTLPESYSYIDANPILNAWRKNRNFFCFPASARTFDAALAQLLADGFTHIVLRDPPKYSKLVPLMFPHTQAAYEDGYVLIYRLTDMRDVCRHRAFLSDDVFPQLYAQLPPATLRLDDNATVLSIHPAADAVGDTEQFYARVTETSSAMLPLTVADIRDNSSGSSQGASDLERRLAENSILLLVYDPRATAPDLIEAYTSWIETSFEACNPFAGTTSLRLQYFVTGDIRCELLNADEPLAARYDNGMRLANALLQFDGERLELRLLWERLTRELHSVSLQVFDEAGARVASADRTIPRHDGPAFALQLDLASLEPGDYRAKLIVYNYDTGAAVPGMVASREAAFDRALELDRVTIE